MLLMAHQRKEPSSLCVPAQEGATKALVSSFAPVCTF